MILKLVWFDEYFISVIMLLIINWARFANTYRRKWFYSKRSRLIRNDVKQREVGEKAVLNIASSVYHLFYLLQLAINMVI